MEKTLLEPAVGTEEAELQYTYWQDGAFFVGFLNDYPDDSTQGLSLAELEDALSEIYEVKQEEKKRLAARRLKLDKVGGGNYSKFSNSSK